MTDEAIMDLYWQRREEAIAATEEKYGGYCRTIARNILADPQDAEECVSDAWLKAWKAMPPHRPPPAGSRRDPPREEGRRAPKARFPRIPSNRTTPDRILSAVGGLVCQKGDVGF